MSRVKREVLGSFATRNRNLLHYDDVDGRKFLYGALGRMTDRQRLAFVRWCARLEMIRGFRQPTQVTAPYSRPGEVYYEVREAVNDLAQLTIGAGHGGPCADVILHELERRVRRL